MPPIKLNKGNKLTGLWYGFKDHVIPEQQVVPRMFNNRYRGTVDEEKTIKSLFEDASKKDELKEGVYDMIREIIANKVVQKGGYSATNETKVKDIVNSMPMIYRSKGGFEIVFDRDQQVCAMLDEAMDKPQASFFEGTFMILLDPSGLYCPNNVIWDGTDITELMTTAPIPCLRVEQQVQVRDTL